MFFVGRNVFFLFFKITFIYNTSYDNTYIYMEGK